MIDLEGNEVPRPSEPLVKWWQFWKWHRTAKIRKEWDAYWFRCEIVLESQLRGVKPLEW